MLVRLPNPASRFLLPSLAFILCAGLSYFSIRVAWAAHKIGLGTAAGFQAAVRWEPSNAENWYLLGRYWQYTLDEPDAERAIRYYRSALALNPHDAGVWMDLGTAYESEGNWQAAGDAFREAKRAYPLSAEVSWRYGNFLLRQDQVAEAFSEIRRAVYADPKRSAEAFSRCWRVDPDVRAILDNVLPANLDGYLDVIHQLAENDEYAAALVVWDRLAAFHPHLTLGQAIPFTEYLVQKRRIEDAQRVWNDALRFSGTESPARPDGSVLWDGGFETGWNNGGFAWRFPRPSGGVRIGFDSKEKHSGLQSLHISFDGRHNVALEGPCVNAGVQAGVPYRFSAWVRAENLTTNQGLRFHLDWAENSGRHGSVETPDVQGSKPWSEIAAEWTAPGDARQVRLCLVRRPSEKLDSQIQGTVWVDDVALVPVSREKRKP